MTPKSVHFVEADGVATITLDRPEALNALTFEVYRELTELFTEIATRSSTRAVVITGTGRAFCTGGDVREIIGDLLNRDQTALRDFTRMTCDLVWAMRVLPQPIVASLNGTVAGAGAAIALAADLRIASESAKIAFLFVRVGLAGADMGSAYLLPRVIGLGRAAELLMTGEFIDAHEAHRIGLYNRVVTAGQLAPETQEVARRLALGPAAGLAMTKDALNREMHMDLQTALGHEAAVQANLMGGPDFREGFQAFVEKRAPRFTSTPRERGKG